MNTRMAAGNETCITMIEELHAEEVAEEVEEQKTLDTLKNTTQHLLQENDKLERGLDAQKKIQLEANATITRLEAMLEELQKKSTTQLVHQLSKGLEEQKKKMEDVQKKIEKLELEKEAVKDN